MAKINKIKGAALPITMFILVGILISASFLIKSAEFSNFVARDMGERSKLLSNNESSIAKALLWLENNKTSLNSDLVASGYFSSYQEKNMYNNENWSNSFKINDNSYYIIFRMCEQKNLAYDGIVSGLKNRCALKEEISNNNSMGIDPTLLPSSNKVFFKIYVKSTGIKNSKIISETTVSIIQ